MVEPVLGAHLDCTGMVEVHLAAHLDAHLYCTGVVELHLGAQLDCTGMVEVHLAAHLVTFESHLDCTGPP